MSAAISIAESTLLPESVLTLPLLDQNSSERTLKEFAGKKIIIYFYPKDDTPGCTTQACDFRDSLAALGDKGYEIIGVSPDSSTSHKLFADKYALPFTLLADPDRKLATAFGVYKERSMYGKITLGIERSTFIIDENGVVTKELRNVKATGHVARLAESLAAS